MSLKGTSQSFMVGDLAAETPEYRLYLCAIKGGSAGATHLLQIASKAEHNGTLDRFGYVLKKLAQEAERLEEEYADTKTDPKDLLNYQLSFPELVDTFVFAEQGNRRVNVLAFRSVPDVQSMVPLYNIVHRDGLRVDLRTSAWIMGKLLKILAFAHSVGITVGGITPGNILIEADKHYVVVFNWANAQLSTDGVGRSTARQEIQAAARAVIELLGGSPEGEDIPDDGSEQFAAYTQHLLALATKGQGSALSAHQAFYALVDGLWPRGYHPFTSHPR